jgi:hypothetical protein
MYGSQKLRPFITKLSLTTYTLGQIIEANSRNVVSLERDNRNNTIFYNAEEQLSANVVQSRHAYGTNFCRPY